MFTILAVGEDLSLLKTRAEVLRKTGANVLCSRAIDALAFIEKWEFDLIVLCHSVGEQDAKQIARAAQNALKTLTLLVISEAEQSRKYGGIDFDAKAVAQPACLVRCATELLHRRGKSNRKIDLIPNAQRKFGRKKPESYPAGIAQRRFLQAS